MDNHFHIVVETIHGRLNAGVRHLNVVYAQPHPRPGWSRLSGRIQGNRRAERSVAAGIGSLRGAQPRVCGHLRLARGLALEQRPNHGGPGSATALVYM